MNKKISVGTLILCIVLAVLLTFQVTALLLGNRYQDQLNSYFSGDSAKLLAKLSEIDSVYRTYYAGELSQETLELYAINGYLYGTEDPYTQYMSAEEWAEYQKEFNGENTGIGIIVSFVQESNALKILRVVSDGAAQKAGLLAGDWITAINGQPVTAEGYLDQLGGLSAGTEVTLSVVRGEAEPMSVTVTSGPYTALNAEGTVFESGGKKFGLIRVLSFDPSALKQFRTEVDKVVSEGVSAIIFDVRGNPGGEQSTVVSAIDYLVPDGETILTVCPKYGDKTEYKGEDTHSVDLPMAVLTDGNTASAAELFACALRDYDMAILVGEKTYGKGCMQNLMTLSDGSMLRVTVGLYNPPRSENYDGVGIIPDVEIAPDESIKDGNVYLVLPTEDNQVMAAVAALNQQ